MGWSQWSGQYYTAETVRWLREDWNIELIRAAMGVEDNGGYMSNAGEKDKVITVVDAAIDLGIYVIIDWHSHYATDHGRQDRARGFFEEMAKRYGHHANVLFETWNEPKHHDWSSVVKPYHADMVGTIRRHSQNLVILGTPSWCQHVDIAANDPLQADNVAYTLHFYADSHKQDLRNKASYALSRNVALFVTEWGTCHASGNGNVNLGESQAWLDFLKDSDISDANWAVNNKAESASILQPGTSGISGWTQGQLTQSGSWMRSSLRGNGGDAGPNCAASTDDCRESKCCADASLTCYEKDSSWASCKASCVPGIDRNDPPQYHTPWSCVVLR